MNEKRKGPGQPPRYNVTAMEIILRLTLGEPIPRLTQTEVAALLGVSRQRLHQILKRYDEIRQINEQAKLERMVTK